MCDSDNLCVSAANSGIVESRINRVSMESNTLWKAMLMGMFYSCFFNYCTEGLEVAHWFFKRLVSSFVKSLYSRDSRLIG